MIENVMLLLKGTMDNPDVNVDELMAQCHPLGMFDAAIMRSICAFENTPQGYMDLYEVVLIELPVGTSPPSCPSPACQHKLSASPARHDAGKYFAQFLVDQTLLSRSGVEVRSILEEVALPVLESSVLKLYLEDFHQFCQRLGGETAAVMGELLAARADAMSVNITLNSFNTPLNEETHREDRRGLYPAIGTMYPGGVDLLANVGCQRRPVCACTADLLCTRAGSHGGGSCGFAAQVSRVPPHLGGRLRGASWPAAAAAAPSRHR